MHVQYILVCLLRKLQVTTSLQTFNDTTRYVNEELKSFAIDQRATAGEEENVVERFYYGPTGTNAGYSVYVYSLITVPLGSQRHLLMNRISLHKYSLIIAIRLLRSMFTQSAKIHSVEMQMVLQLCSIRESRENTGYYPVTFGESSLFKGNPQYYNPIKLLKLDHRFPLEANCRLRVGLLLLLKEIERTTSYTRTWLLLGITSDYHSGNRIIFI